MVPLSVLRLREILPITPRSTIALSLLRLLERQVFTLSDRMNYLHLSYAEWYQTIEKPRLEAIPQDMREANANSHVIGFVDECSACIKCECKSWNTWKVACPA